MPPPCVIERCKRKSRALCHCCNKNLCPDHLNEHDDSFNSQVNPIVDEFNSIANQLLEINVNNVISNCRQNLNKWRDHCHMIIDHFYEEKCGELQQRCYERIDKQRKEIDQMKLKTNELIREQEATYEDIPSLKAIINDIKRDINQFEEKGIIIATRPLIINKDLVYIEEWTMNKFDISTLLSPCRTINCSDKDEPMLAANNRYLLLNLNPNLCLFDRELAVIKQTLWKYNRIFDICWSSTLNCFIIITEKDGVFLINENLTTIELIQTIEQKNWLSCTCSDAVLFLTINEYGSNIFEFNLLSSFQLIKQWDRLKSCKYDEFIHNISYNNGTIALTIENKSEKTVRIELRSSTTLDRLWSLPLDITYSIGHRINRVCFIKCNEWLVIDQNTSRFLHISQDGNLKMIHRYPSTPLNAVLFGSNIFVIRTIDKVRFYRV